MELQASIDDLSRVSSSKTSYDKGFEAEDIVASYYQKQNFILISQRKKIAGVEVDLVFQHQVTSEVLAVEVKSVTRGFENYLRLRPAQIRRLRRAFQVLVENSAHPVEMKVVFVDLIRRRMRVSHFHHWNFET